MVPAYARASGGNSPPSKNYFICDIPMIDAEDGNRIRMTEIRGYDGKMQTKVFTEFALANGTVNNDPHKINQESWILAYTGETATAIGSGRASEDGSATAPGAGRAVALMETTRGDSVKYKQYADLHAVAKLEADAKRAAAKGREPGARDEMLRRRYPEERANLIRNVLLTSKCVSGVTPDGIRHQVADLAKHLFIYGVGSSKNARYAENVEELKAIPVGKRDKTVGSYIPMQDDINAVAKDYFRTYCDLLKEALHGPVRVTTRNGEYSVTVPNLSDLGFKGGVLDDGTVELIAPESVASDPRAEAAIASFNDAFQLRFSQLINGTYSAENAEKIGVDANAYTRIRSIGNAMALNTYVSQPKYDSGKAADFIVVNPVSSMVIMPFINAAERGFAAARHQEYVLDGVVYNSKNGDSAELTTETLFGKAVTEIAAEIDSYGPAQHVLPQLDPKLTGADRTAAIIARQGTIDDIRAERMRELSDIANGRASFSYDFSTGRDLSREDDNSYGNNFPNETPANTAIEERKRYLIAAMEKGYKYTIAIDSMDERDTLYGNSVEGCGKMHLYCTMTDMLRKAPVIGDLFADGSIPSSDRIKADQDFRSIVGEAMNDGRQFIVTECIDDPHSVLMMAVWADQVRIENGDKKNDQHRTVCADVENVKPYGYDWPMKLTLATDGEPKWELRQATAKEIVDCAAYTGFEKVDVRIYGDGPDKAKAHGLANSEPTSLFRRLMENVKAEDKNDECDYDFST